MFLSYFVWLRYIFFCCYLSDKPRICLDPLWCLVYQTEIFFLFVKQLLSGKMRTSLFHMISWHYAWNQFSFAVLLKFNNGTFLSLLSQRKVRRCLRHIMISKFIMISIMISCFVLCLFYPFLYKVCFDYSSF